MPSYPVKVRGKYAIWSTVCDAPLTPFVASLERLREIAPNYVALIDHEPWRADLLEKTGMSILGYQSHQETEETLETFNTCGNLETWEPSDHRPRPNLSIDELLIAFADDPAGHRRAARNLGDVDQAFACVEHAVQREIS